MAAQFADPQVSRLKFDREITEFRALREHYAQRGCFLVHADFPSALVLLATPKTPIPALLTGVAFDYSNYDAAPPSVRLVHPISGEPFTHSKLPTALLRAVPPLSNGPESPEGRSQGAKQAVQPLMQAHRADDIPFLCLAGVREYHEHPAHNGDSWEIHRTTGAGRLVRLLEVILHYGVEPISGFAMQIAFAIAQVPV